MFIVDRQPVSTGARGRLSMHSGVPIASRTMVTQHRG
jgi:hypothetical protein